MIFPSLEVFYYFMEIRMEIRSNFAYTFSLILSFGGQMMRASENSCTFTAKGKGHNSSFDPSGFPPLLSQTVTYAFLWI